MKKGGAVIAGCLLAAGFLAFAAGGRRPYKGLNASDIASACVRLTPPGRTAEITDREELAGHLKELTVYHESDEFWKYSGQSASFALAMADGSREEIMVCAPFVVINGTGYKAKYEPCEVLGRYADGVLKDTE